MSPIGVFNTFHIYAFSLHIQFASSLEGRSPKTFLCYSKERGLKQMFPISKSAQPVYAGLGHTHIYILIMEELPDT